MKQFSLINFFIIFQVSSSSALIFCALVTLFSLASSSPLPQILTISEEYLPPSAQALPILPIQPAQPAPRSRVVQHTQPLSRVRSVLYESLPGSDPNAGAPYEIILEVESQPIVLTKPVDRTEKRREQAERRVADRNN